MTKCVINYCYEDKDCDKKLKRVVYKKVLYYGIFSLEEIIKCGQTVKNCKIMLVLATYRQRWPISPFTLKALLYQIYVFNIN